jgi:N4-gp56 family major capsid protein
MSVTQNTPTVNTGTSSLGPMIAQHWVEKGLRQLLPSVVLHELAADGGPNSYIRIPARKGKVLHFHRSPILTPSYTAINESADDPTPDSFAMTGVSASVAMYGRVIVTSDLAEGIPLKSALMECGKGLALAGLRTYANLIGGEASANGTKYYCGDATSNLDLTATDILSRAELEKLQMKLHANNVPSYEDGSYKIVCHPVAIHELRGDTATNSLFALSQYINLHEGEKRDFVVDRVAGFKVMESTDISATSSISASSGYGYQNIWSGYEGVGCLSLAGANLPGGTKKTLEKMTKKPRFDVSRSNFELIIKLMGSAGTADPLNRRATTGFKLWTAAKVLQSQACGMLMSASAYSQTGA